MFTITQEELQQVYQSDPSPGCDTGISLDISHKPIKLLQSLKACDVYMHQRPSLALLHMMASHIFGAKVSSEPVLAYC